MRCRRVRALISPRVPRNVGFTGQENRFRASCDQLANTFGVNSRAQSQTRGHTGRSRVRALACTPWARISEKEPTAREHPILFKTRAFLCEGEILNLVRHGEADSLWRACC
jgi:hypothetical protein